MGKAIMNVAAVSLDGFIADNNDGINPLFDWLDNGDVTWRFGGTERELRTTQSSADFMQSHYHDVAAAVRPDKRLERQGRLCWRTRLRRHPSTADGLGVRRHRAVYLR